MKATLALETGKVYTGRAFGAEGETVGEVVFCTALTGYQEILTDPSYRRQIVVMTYPHIGNYGTWDALNESRKPFVAGFVAREFSATASHQQSTATLESFMKKHGVVGIDDIDTRALVRHLREVGCKQGLIATGDVDPKKLVARAKKAAGMVGSDLAREVTCDEPYEWRTAERENERMNDGVKRPISPSLHPSLSPSQKHKVVVIDYGVKWNILNSLAARGCSVTVVPATASADSILALRPDGVMLSNGPGDPAAVTYGIKTIRDLVAHSGKATKSPLPIFGICLGHQMLGIALGGKTYKLKFGHRGANHPVKDLTTGKVEVTTQNHGFAVDIDSLAGKSDIELTHLNLNDQTCEGLRHKHLPVFSVQYHPESNPGPHDAHYLFDRFINLMGKS
jgi:carbamoyl-phosphate synthase small subunit